jgi:hypothetical protein
MASGTTSGLMTGLLRPAALVGGSGGGRDAREDAGAVREGTSIPVPAGGPSGGAERGGAPASGGARVSGGSAAGVEPGAAAGGGGGAGRAGAADGEDWKAGLHAHPKDTRVKTEVCGVAIVSGVMALRLCCGVGGRGRAPCKVHVALLVSRT